MTNHLATNRKPGPEVGRLTSHSVNPEYIENYWFFFINTIFKVQFCISLKDMCNFDVLNIQINEYSLHWIDQKYKDPLNEFTM